MNDTHEPLLDWAGDDASLSDTEADAMFGEVFPSDAPSQRESAKIIPLWTRGLLLAALALVIASFWPAAPEAPTRHYSGVKSPSTRAPLRLDLMAFSARAGNPPTIGRELRDGDTLAPGESIVFRYALSTSATMLLVSSGTSPEILWSSEVPMEPGEREIAHASQALAMNPTPHAPRVALSLVAVPVGEDVPKTARDALEVCTSCTRATLWLNVSEEQ